MIKQPISLNYMKNCEDICRYIEGGRGIVRLEAPSGNYHNYAFLRPREPSEFPVDVVFVYTVHDDGKQHYIGMVERSQFRLTKHSRYLDDNEIVKGARYIVRMAHNQFLCNTTPMKLYNWGICCRCGRPLHDIKWRYKGIGKKCLELNEGHHYVAS